MNRLSLPVGDDMTNSKEMLIETMLLGDPAGFESAFSGVFDPSRYSDDVLIDAFYFAVAHDLPEIVTLLIPQCRPHCWDALCASAIQGIPQCLAALLPWIPQEGLRRALDGAASHGQTECVKLLLGHCPEGSAVLAAPLAAAGGHVDCLALLIDAAGPGAPLRGALASASRAGQAPALRLLLDLRPAFSRADLEMALDEAAASGDCACVEALLQALGARGLAGAESAPPDASPCRELPAPLLRARACLNALLQGTHNGNVACVDVLTKARLAVAPQKYAGRALRLAARAGSLESVKMLVGLSSQRAKNEALLQAVCGWNDFLSCVEFLLPHVPSLDIRAEAFRLALRRGDPQCAQLLAPAARPSHCLNAIDGLPDNIEGLRLVFAHASLAPKRQGWPAIFQWRRLREQRILARALSVAALGRQPRCLAFLLERACASTLLRVGPAIVKRARGQGLDASVIERALGVERERELLSRASAAPPARAASRL